MTSLIELRSDMVRFLAGQRGIIKCHIGVAALRLARAGVFWSASGASRFGSGLVRLACSHHNTEAAAP
ncbi:hypothetical protein AOE01nite_02660 [Acetobacter oeni]|uniref:Uncharacterized protein n=1 Tax=Acetobacter oeni TaxID=304077 RepID=A0A511XGG7_9PROT|nr:hypothetical protein AA21952_0616 [Acetobacter oeni LMG 21952]GEN62042.1 hypothetical protein AOE01nite_02660 [Acetobacter oeni]